ncbi:MAG: lipoate--protein ligase family protein [Candidatus Helarchaeota archaeon]
MKTFRIIRDSKYIAPMGLSIDEALLQSVSRNLVPNTIRFYYFTKPSVIVGINQDINDVNLEFIKKNNLSFGRRLTGGGSIIIGAPRSYSQVGISFLFKLGSDLPLKMSHKFKYFCSIIINTLKNLGLNPEYNKNSDITINGKKIAGNGIYLTENSMLFHSMILFDYDFKLMFRVLKHRNFETQKEMIDFMEKKITTLKIEKKKNVPTKIVENELINSIKSIWGGEIMEDQLTVWEKSVAKQLCKEKYSTEAWNFQSIDNKGLLGACFVPSNKKETNK